MGQNRPLFVYFRYFLITTSIIEKSIDGVLGIRTLGRRRNHGAMYLNLQVNMLTEKYIFLVECTRTNWYCNLWQDFDA